MHHGSAALSPLDRQMARRRLRIALGLALGVLAAEVAGGLAANSLALLADAGHVLGDAAAVGLALGAIWLATRPGGPQQTYGWYRLEILAAQANAVALVAIAGVVTWQAVERIGESPAIDGGLLLGVAAGGLVANLASAWLLHGSQRENLNVRAAYYHVLGDTLGSLGALLAGAVILATGWTPIDVIASLLIAALLLVGALRLFRETITVLLEAAPPGLDVRAVAGDLAAMPGVVGVHDLHLWTVTSGFAAISAHLEVNDAADGERILLAATERLQTRFGLRHITLQPETVALHTAMACCEYPDSR